jgi:hypothetical protein
MRLSLTGVLVVAVSLFLVTADASAQMNNKPFSFSNGGPSLGMSAAARQAILNQKLTGATPDNIMRGPGGALITITEGPNNIAIATGQDGVVLQGYHGRGTALSGGVGIFNPYFLGNAGQRSGGYTLASRLTGNAIAGWTSMVGGATPYNSGNSIDAWTSLIGG